MEVTILAESSLLGADDVFHPKKTTNLPLVKTGMALLYFFLSVRPSSGPK